MTHTTLGRRIHTARKQAGLRQEDLARATGYHRVTIARIETDTRRPSRTGMALIAAALGVDGETLARGERLDTRDGGRW